MSSVCYVIPFAKSVLAKNVLSKIKLLKSSGFKVTVICFEGSGVNLLVNRCIENGIDIRRIVTNELNIDLTIQNIPFLVSFKIREILISESYDIIRFVDFMGSAFHCIQGKRVCGEFTETTLVVDMYGASQFRNEAGECWGYGGFEQLLVQYMERYSCEFGDVLTSPTDYMYDWAISRRWRLCEKRYVIPHICISESQSLGIPNTSHLIFCGEYSKAGGLHLFCNALRRLSKESLNKITNITFIGEMSNVGDIPAETYIHDAMNSISMQYKILNDLEPTDIILECKRNNGILVFPQITSNNDGEIVTAVANNLPLIAMASDAHKEILDEKLLFDNSPASLAVKIQTIEDIDFSTVSNKYNGYIARANWLESNNIKSTNLCKTSSSKPLVSICIAFYNHGKFLDMALSSIEKLDYPSLEVIVVNDGSTDIKSIERFHELKAIYQNNKFKFYSKINEGPSITRNYAASIATGDYLLFMDADNIAKPNMVSSFVDAMQRSGCDCLTCYFDQFWGEGKVANSSRGLTYALVGPSLELGVFSNCFGDTNFIVKRKVFQELGGFYKSRVVTEDWQFLSNLVLSGFTLDVLPSSLFWYRVLPESNVSFGSEYLKQQIILETYCKRLPPYVYHVFNSLCRPTLESNHHTDDIPEIVKKIIKRPIAIANKVLPVNTKRRNIFKKIMKIIFRVGG
ncbi:glycosyltransferase [Desulforamulus aeronauticus]|uniref:Glycosyl transferase family 2 n=1 Tax=Desulforamulus aeronauticus DSM 10349 TaxID=1121421 RepID=A0A1M6T519_9FIRM|nr:glycosyltransferase [Desulforamulus aeronauticus]SHK52051.1 Glycosyl transferase family 2 [Desulforamulus aeronauticus DSM 10349]